MLSRLVIAFLPRSKCLLLSWLESPSAVILEPPKIKSLTVSILSPSICHEVMGLDAMILVFWMLSFKSTFSLSTFTFIQSPRSVGVPYITRKNKEIGPERKMKLSQSGNYTQLWLYLVLKVNSDSVKNDIAQEPGMLGPRIKANLMWSNRRWQEWTSTF